MDEILINSQAQMKLNTECRISHYYVNKRIAMRFRGQANLLSVDVGVSQIELRGGM